MAVELTRAAPSSADSSDYLRTAFQPGGWGDRIVFGYMFRVVSAVAAVITPMLIVSAWGAINGWQMTTPMLIFYALTVIVMVSSGEAMRIGVYESRIRPKPHKSDNYAGVTQEFLQMHGHATWGYRIAKRAVDISIASLSLAAFFPIFITVGLLIRFDSRGPVVVSMRRIGRYGREFKMYKFRTFEQASDQETAATVTRVGRFLRATSFDELPQLVNVLQGDMSIVGPRPMAIAQAVLHKSSTDAGEVNAALELMKYAKPGITGIQAQDGSHPNSVLEYVLRRSVMRDFRIMVTTVFFMLRKP